MPVSRLRRCAGRTLGLAALLLLGVGPLAAPAGAQVPPWSAGFPGMGPFPGAGTLPDPSYYYGVAGLNGFAGYPGLGMAPGVGSYYGMNGGPAFGGLPGFQASTGLPGVGSYLNSTAASSASASPSPTQNLRLTIGDNFFMPAEISVPAGAEITWLNTGSVRHTTTASGLWDSGAIDPGARWSAVFRVPGTYEYVCTIHPQEMHGRLTITAS